MTAIETPRLETARTLLVGAGGAVLFWLIGFPAAVLTGPAVSVSIAALMGWRMSVPSPFRNAVFLVLGLQIGSTVTPKVIATALTWPLSLAVLSIALIVTMLLATMVLKRGFGYDRMTALLAATPGHLSYVLGLSLHLRVDVPKLVLVQTIRVLMLTVLVPVLIAVWGVQGTAPLADRSVISLVPLLIIVPLAQILGMLFKTVGVPAPILMGAMGISALGHGFDLTPGILPPWLTLIAFVGMGSLIGTRLSGVDRSGLMQALEAGVVTTLVACAVAAGGAWLASGLVGLPPGALLLAFAPGGVEVMAALAVETGLEPAFVAAHHVFRLFVLSLFVPVLVRRTRA
jgi:hypothetical protein